MKQTILIAGTLILLGFNTVMPTAYAAQENGASQQDHQGVLSLMECWILYLLSGVLLGLVDLTLVAGYFVS